MPNTDERRAFDIVSDGGRKMYIEGFLLKWQKFLAEKSRYGKPQDIADEFIRRYSEI